MANITLKTPTSYEVDWSHPAFKGRKAIVIVGGKPVTKGKGELDYIVNAVDGTSRIDASAKGIAWHGTGVGTKVNLARVLGEHTSALVVMGSGSIRTNRSGGGYYIGYSALSLGGVQFGTGGSPGTSSRRNWSWASGNVCCIVPHATSMATAPMVYVDGCKRTPSDTGGTGTTISWGTASTDNYEVGYDPGNGTTNQNDRVVLAVFFSGALPEALAKSLSENPWQIFKNNAPALYLSVAAGGRTGTLAATESGSDTASISGDVLVKGALAATESGADTASISGDVLVKGALAATESGADSAALAGKVFVEGALSASESGADTAALAGDVLVKGALAAAESGSDSASFIGEGFVPTSTGTLAASESGSDTASIAGKVYIAGTLSAVEGGLDGFAASGDILVKGAMAASETGDDTAAFAQEVLTLTQADLDAIAAAVWADPAAVTAHAKLDEIIARITC